MEINPGDAVPSCTCPLCSGEGKRGTRTCWLCEGRKTIWLNTLQRWIADGRRQHEDDSW